MTDFRRLPNRSPPPSTSSSATSASAPASAPTPVVEVRPSDREQRTRTSRPPSRPASSSPAGSCSSRRRSCARWSPRSHGGSIDVTIELPAGSQLRASGQLTRLRAATARSATAGSRPACGDDPARATAATAEPQDRRRRHRRRARRPATPTSATGSGDVRVRELDGSAVGQELQRRHLGRRGRRRAAGQRRQRQHRRRRRARERRRQVRQRRRAPRRRRRAARSCSRRGSATSRSASARAPPPGSTCAPLRASVLNTLEAAEAPEPLGRDRRGARPHDRRQRPDPEAGA